MHPALSTALDTALEPFSPLGIWLNEATEDEPRVPDAMQVATVDARGRPSLRTVLLKEATEAGLVFYTNLGSRKARDLAARPQVALLLHWKSLERQVIAEGHAIAVADTEADAYFATRPRGSQLGAWASRQSEAIEPAGALHERMAEVTARFEGGAVPRPQFWSGFRVVPDRIEFWQGRPDRLHVRVLFERADGGWIRSVRYP